MYLRNQTRGRRNPATPTSFVGDGHDVLLQGFHWDSWRGAQEKGRPGRSWYQIMKENAHRIKEAGFSRVWFPPSSDSLAPEGYIPRRWNVLDSAYGREDELRAAIASIAPAQAIADIVVNHRVGVATSGADFEDPPFLDNRAAIVRDDESGVGTGNADTGERYPAGRDLDHTNEGVKQAVRGYLGRLRDVGFTGWRYDFTKGFAGRFVREYNEATSPGFSVGEYYETDRPRVTDWVDSTGGTSAAFDFPTRYRLYEACLADDYSGLRSDKGGKAVPAGLIGFWPSRAVTFVDNHDTEARRERDHVANYDSTRHFPGKKVEMAYAYILTHPGVPCVFWPHFFDWGAETQEKVLQMIKVRRFAGLHADSAVEIRAAENGLYAAVIDEHVAVKLGSRDWSPGPDWHLAVSGERYAIWTRD
jgi:alpha-amylase